jgi:hypothetical protein
MKRKLPAKYQKLLGQGQEIAPFRALREELLVARECLPEVTIRRQNGKVRKLGDILPFVKGLRLSARLIYILRDKLQDSDVQVNWGHVQDDRQRLCSPECDIIIHNGGVTDTWNGRNHQSVMDFRFIRRDAVKAIISCKSKCAAIDSDFPKVVKRDFRIKYVFLFAESVQETKFAALKKKAKAAGYAGIWPLYRLDTKGGVIQDPQDYLDFLGKVRSVL